MSILRTFCQFVFAKSSTASSKAKNQPLGIQAQKSSHTYSTSSSELSRSKMLPETLRRPSKPSLLSESGSRWLNPSWIESKFDDRLAFSIPLLSKCLPTKTDELEV